MRYSRFSHALLLAIVMVTVQGAAAQVPNTMTFTGTLSTPDGQPRNGTFDMTFQIFPVPAGGSPLFGQTVPGVVVRQGQFSVLLSGFPDNVLRQGPGDRYVQIQVQSETPILPRQHLVSVPFAQRTASVDGAQAGVINGSLQLTDRLQVHGAGGVGGGMWLYRSNAPSSGSFVGRGADSETVTGVYANGVWKLTVDDSGSVNVPSGDLSLYGKTTLRGSDNWLRLNPDRTYSSGVFINSLLNPNSLSVGGINGGVDPGLGNALILGNLGVGTASPQARLDVSGDAQVSGQVRGTKGPLVYAGPAVCGQVLTLSSSCLATSPCTYYCNGDQTCNGFRNCDGRDCLSYQASCSASVIGRLVAP